jgi:catechol 2,3-dioxygenase-like lactoylglutathione lyase family enzyme
MLAVERADFGLPLDSLLGRHRVLVFALAAASALARWRAWIRSGVESVVSLHGVSRTWRWLRPRVTSGHEGRATREGIMTIQRMDNVGIVVDDLAAAIAFFVELGLELEGKAQVEGSEVDRLVGLDGVRCDMAVVRTPDGHGRLELMKFHTPAATTAESNAPVNTLGIRRIMFAVEDIEDVLARLRAHGAELMGELVRYEDSYQLCYVRGPEGIIVALAEKLD